MVFFFSCQRQASTCVECTSVLIDFFRQHNVLSLIYLHSVIFLSLFWLFYKTPRHNQYFNSFMLCLFYVLTFHFPPYRTSMFYIYHVYNPFPEASLTILSLSSLCVLRCCVHYMVFVGRHPGYKMSITLYFNPQLCLYLSLW